MRKPGRIILVAAVLVVTAAVAYGLYVWNKPARDVRDEAGIKVSAVDLFAAFSNNEAAANARYLNKAIEVTGKVAEVQKNQAGKTVVYLQSNDPVFGINCTFKEDPGIIAANSNITFKGICTGYLQDVIVNEGVLVK